MTAELELPIAAVRSGCAGTGLAVATYWQGVNMQVFVNVQGCDDSTQISFEDVTLEQAAVLRLLGEASLIHGGGCKPTVEGGLW